LIKHHVALWDVLAAATRSGSLDAAIARQTLPSTSGAHASLSFAEKVARWSILWGGV
jgi:G:T/U-mismatch repair DNA glycosylase